MPANPFFSIIIPTYNRAGIIGTTLNSFINQTFTEFEILVIDDGSSDNTMEVMRSWIDKDNRIKYFRKENAERGAARNYGIARAIGQYISFIDSDDFAYPFALQAAYIKISANSDLSCLALGYEIRDMHSGTLISRTKFDSGKDINKLILKGNVLSCIGVFIKSDVLQQFKFEEDRMFAGTEDWLLWLQLSVRYPFVTVDDVCFCMIQHDKRSVMNFSEEKLLYRGDHLRKYLAQDKVFLNVAGQKAINRIYAHMLSYISLHLTMGRKRKKALSYLYKAIITDYREFFTRRFFAILKKLVLPI